MRPDDEASPVVVREARGVRLLRRRGSAGAARSDPLTISRRVATHHFRGEVRFVRRTGDLPVVPLSRTSTA